MEDLISEMKRDPIISVITPSFNNASYLPALIESVRIQTYQNFEHIIIDDGSFDDGATKEVLGRYSHLQWWSRENKGQYITQNEGIQAAKGDIIVIIAADDVFFSNDIFQLIIDCWEENPKYELIYGHTARMDENKSLLPVLDVNRPPSQWLIKQVCYIQHCSLFVSRSFLLKNQLFFDPVYKFAGDWDWIIRLLKTSQNIGYIPKPLSIIRMHQNQTSRINTIESIALEHRKVSKAHGGSYWIHSISSKLINWRGMVLLGQYTIRNEGIRAFRKKFSLWLVKKFQ
jgi:glycosyltransferase involved in cell wall biosynthesis